MNTQDLIENTVLYTLGLLEEDEQQAYEAAITRADPRVRARVRAEAERMADLGDLLPEEQPAPELRELVIAAVRAGMREQEVERRLAASAASAAVAGRIDPAVAAAAARPERRYTQPALPRHRRVHPVWRAAAIGLAAATIALTVDSLKVRGTYQAAGEHARFAELYDATGAAFVDDALYDANTQRVVFTPAATEAAEMGAGASVWYNPDWGSARLFVKNLRAQQNDEPYRLVVLDADGNVVREVAQFRPSGERQDFEINVNLATESRLAIYQGVRDAVRNQPVLRSVDADL